MERWEEGHKNWGGKRLERCIGNQSKWMNWRRIEGCKEREMDEVDKEMAKGVGRKVET